MRQLKALLLALSTVCSPLCAQTDTEVTIKHERSGAVEVIDLPEGMVLSSDSLLGDWMAKKYLYPDTTCVDPDVNPTFTTEEYQDRLKRLPVVMEMPHNEVVQKFIDQYSGRLRSSVAYMLGAGNFYVPIFEEALDFYGLPLELKYLPFIESALNPTAKSKAGAVGLWQFMLPTAKRYDLKVNSLVDERCHPYKATWAAVRYLRDLYRIFGDWSLVIAAYNCGPGNVNKAIHRAGGVKDYWTIYPYLPAETRGYVPAFIAANYIMNYYCEHNICPMKTLHPLTTDTLLVDRDLHMDQVVELCHIDKDALKALNPQYRTDIIPGNTEPQVLCLPAEALNTLIDLGDSIYNYRAEELFTRRDVVKMTETTETTTSSHQARTKSKRSSKSKKQGSKQVTVRSGDTLSDIARRNHTTVDKLRRLNGIKGSNIRAGKKIRVK